MIELAILLLLLSKQAEDDKEYKKMSKEQQERAVWIWIDLILEAAKHEK